jgi:hypothetical protein
VTDANGVAHKASVGYTLPGFTRTITITGIHPTPSKTLGRRCYSATAHVVYTLNQHISILTWTPTPAACDANACASALAQWQARILAHEQQHEAIYNHELQKLDSTLASYPLTVCIGLLVKPGAATAQALNTQFDLAATLAADAIAEPFNKQTDLLDVFARDAGPNCSACAPCPCPTGQLLFNGTCANQCGSITPTDSTGCGMTAAKQPRACCQLANLNQFVCSPYGSVCSPQ